MYILFLYLMSYRAGRGLYLHSVLGCILFAVFLFHHVLNLRWYQGLGKGKYTLRRTIFVMLDFLLLAAMVIMAISSVMMSGDVFAFSPFMSTQFGRDLHICSTAWGFFLTVLHIGLHTNVIFAKLRHKAKETIFAYVYDLFFFLLFIAGVWCFILSGLWMNMLHISRENSAFLPFNFYGEYLMTTLVACQFIYLLLSVMNRLKKLQK